MALRLGSDDGGFQGSAVSEQPLSRRALAASPEGGFMDAMAELGGMLIRVEALGPMDQADGPMESVVMIVARAQERVGEAYQTERLSTGVFRGGIVSEMRDLTQTESAAMGRYHRLRSEKGPNVL